MELDLTFFALAIPATLFAGISKGGFGSGASFGSAAILAMVLDPAVSLGLMLPLLMLIDVASIRPYWGQWHGPSAKWMIIGSVPGITVAFFVFSIISDDFLRLLIGVICIFFVLYQAARRGGLLQVGNRPFGRVGATVAGALTGFTSFVSHAGGPPAAIYLLSLNLDKTAYQATTVILFWAVNLVKFGFYIFLGVFTVQTLMADLYLAPFAVIGAWLGVRAHHIVPERPFFAITYILLTLTGLRLIYLGLT